MAGQNVLLKNLPDIDQELQPRNLGHSLGIYHTYKVYCQYNITIAYNGRCPFNYFETASRHDDQVANGRPMSRA